MDLKILAVVAVLVTLVGLAVAMPSIYNGYMNATWHGNWSRNVTAHRPNMMGSRCNMTNSTFNATGIQEFKQAVMDGNYSEARQLHSEYGLGGRMFGCLNESTFAQYSQIMKLGSDLRRELGMNDTVGLGQFNKWHGIHHPTQNGSG